MPNISVISNERTHGSSLITRCSPHSMAHFRNRDMFTLNGRDYLIIADYHSKFPIIEDMTKDTTIKAVAKVTKKVFALFGVPNKIISDNGPQFIGHHFQDMMTKFGITRVTSSPVQPKSHGFSAVKTVTYQKSLIRKSPDDISTALLLHRTTPIGTGLPSPAELFSTGRYHTTCPYASKVMPRTIIGKQ